MKHFLKGIFFIFFNRTTAGNNQQDHRNGYAFYPGALVLHLLLFLTAGMFTACNSAKRAQRTTPPEQEIEDTSIVKESASTDTVKYVEPPRETYEPVSTVLEKLNNVTYSTFSGRAAVAYTTKGDTKNFDVKLQIRKDSLIWASIIGPLGIEVIRGMITKDSVRILNKITRQYITTDFGYLQGQLGLPLDLASLQDLLIGNPVFLDRASSSYTRDADTLLISSTTRMFKNLLKVGAADFLTISSRLDDVSSERGRSAELAYSAYEPVNDAQFSRLRHINVKYKNDIKIKLEFKSFNLNGDLSTPFSVPKGYKTIR